VPSLYSLFVVTEMTVALCRWNLRRVSEPVLSPFPSSLLALVQSAKHAFVNVRRGINDSDLFDPNFVSSFGAQNLAAVDGKSARHPKNIFDDRSIADVKRVLFEVHEIRARFPTAVFEKVAEFRTCEMR